MTEPMITKGGADTWVNNESGKSGRNYGDTNAVHVKLGDRRGLVRPPLPNILGRTITSATLYGHAGPAGLVAQEFSLAPCTEHWTQGRATWTNQPAVDTGAYVYSTVGALDPGALVAFDVTDHLQAVADGTADYHGWRLGTDSSTAGQRFYSTQSGEPAWELHVNLMVDADEPTNLRPDGGAVPTNLPILAWDFDDQAEFQVQVDTPPLGDDPDETTPDFATGWMVSPSPEYDLAASSYTPPGGSAPTFWRVRVRDTDANESEWSPWAEYTVSALPTLVVDSPTGVVGDPRVTVVAHLASGGVSQWEVWATGPDRSDVRHTSGARQGTISYEIPAKNANGKRIFTEDKGGWIYLRVWDSVDRTVTVGQQTYVDAWVPVEFGTNGALVAPTDLNVSQHLNGDPRLVWQFTLTDVPDAVNLMVDGVTVETIDAADLPAPSLGVYTLTDGGQVAPMRPHTLGVAAVWGNEASTPATVLKWSHVVEGVWLLPDAEVDGEQIAPFWLAGTAVTGFAQSDRVATYTPVVGPPVDITYDWEGFSGTFEGVVDNRQDVWATLARIEQLRTSRVRTARLVWGSDSITVRVRDIHATSTDNITRAHPEHVVRFGFIEVD